MQEFIWNEKKFIGDNFIITSECSTITHTRGVAGDIPIIVRNAINLILRMSYFITEPSILPNTPQGWFQVHAFSIYSRLAYTIVRTF